MISPYRTRHRADTREMNDNPRVDIRRAIERHLTHQATRHLRAARDGSFTTGERERRMAQRFTGDRFNRRASWLINNGPLRGPKREPQG